MADVKEYGYFIKGNKIAIVEKDTAFDNDANSRDYGPGSNRAQWKSPLSTQSDGLELEYTYAPNYFIDETNDISSTVGNYMSDDGQLVITSRTVTLTGFADGTDGDTTDTTVTCANHGFSNGDSVIITGTSNYNGTYTIDQVTDNTFDIEDGFASGETTGSSTTLATLNTNYGSLSGYNIADGSYIVLKNAGRFNGLHKTITKDAHNGVSNGKIKLETKYSGSTLLSDPFSQNADLYYNISVMNTDTAEDFELPVTAYQADAMVYYIKAKIAEDRQEYDKYEYLMSKFKKMIEQNESAKIWGARIMSSGPNGIR